MCTAVALPVSELPVEVVEANPARVHDRGGEREVRFYLRAVPALLPVWWNGRLHVLRWGNRDRADRKLPPCAWTLRATVEDGRWAALEPEPVDIPIRYGYAGGVWYKVREGVRGLVVRSQAGTPVVFLICEPSTRYYRVMTREEWMPVLINETI